MSKKEIFTNLIRHQLVGGAAYFIDFAVLLVLTESFGLWYVSSNAIGSFVGALFNFFMSSYWAFRGSKKNSLKGQMFKYALVSSGSLVLNTLFVYLMTDLLNFDYKLSKLITAAIIGVFYNFLLMRNYVFKKQEE